MAEEVRQEDLVGEIGFDDESIKISDVDFYKGVTGRTDRIGIVSQRVKRVRAHWYKGLGYVMCRSKPSVKNDKGVVIQEAEKALCCEKLPAAKMRCAVVIVQYTTDRHGEINRDHLSYQVLAWTFGEDKYVLIRAYNKEMPISENDLKVICSDAGFQKLQFMPAKGSMWQKEQLGWEKDIREEAAVIEAKLPFLMGKLLSDEEILEAVGGTVNPPSMNTTGEEKDLDSVLDGMA